MSDNPNDKQVGGTHYKGDIEVWDFITANNIGYLAGNAIKYVARHHKKNGIEDLKKAIHYIEKLIAGLEDESQQAEVIRNELEWEAVQGGHNYPHATPRLTTEEVTEKVSGNKKGSEEPVEYPYYFPY